MKSQFFTVLITLCLLGCASAGSKILNVDKSAAVNSRKPASAWINELTCDEGLRVDRTAQFAERQIVLFGEAAQHFEQSGAYGRDRLNAAGEFVSQLFPFEGGMLIATLRDGGLKIQNPQLMTDSNFIVDWIRYQGAPGTNYVFHRCRKTVIY